MFTEQQEREEIEVEKEDEPEVSHVTSHHLSCDNHVIISIDTMYRNALKREVVPWETQQRSIRCRASFAGF